MKNKLTLPLSAGKPLDRKLLILIGLILVTVLVVLYQANSGSGNRVSVTPTPTKENKSDKKIPGISRQDKSDNPLNTEDPDLTSQLKKDVITFENEKRNLFSFYQPPPPEPPPPPDPVCGDGQCNGNETNETCSSDCRPPAPPPFCGNQKCDGNENNQSCPDDCPPPPPEKITFKYIGYLKDHIGPVAFLTDGKEVYMGRVDDIIANRYRVIKITEEGVELGFISLKTGQTETIAFSGEKS